MHAELCDTGDRLVSGVLGQVKKSSNPPFAGFEGRATRFRIERDRTRRNYHVIHAAHQPIYV